MKKLIIIGIIFTCTHLSLNAQTFMKFCENGLMDKCNAFGPLLCPVDQEKINKIIEAVSELKVEKRHINGYCEARAHFIASKIAPLYQGSGCNLGKIWAFAPSIYTLISEEKLSTPNPLFIRDTINWDYHVAPLLSIKNGDKIDTVVIDYSIKEGSYIEYHEWLKKLNCKKAVYTFTDYNYYLFYTLNGLVLTGSKFHNDTLPPNLPKVITGHFYYLNQADTISISSGLAYNDLACHLVDKYWMDNKFSTYKDVIKSNTKLKEMKLLTSERCHNLPDEIIKESNKYYNERLKYWTAQSKWLGW